MVKPYSRLKGKPHDPISDDDPNAIGSHRSRGINLKRVNTVDELTRANVETIARMERAADTHRTLGERVADGFATVVGSWTCIIIQSVLLAGWIALNVLAWVRHWDPYPFILLNLALSFQAAYTGPIVMMSQNRQAKLDDRRNHLDLQINLLAEQENTEMLRLLRRICEKIGVEVEDEKSLQALERQTKPEKVVREIERNAEHAIQDAKDRRDKPKQPAEQRARKTSEQSPAQGEQPPAEGESKAGARE